MNVPMDKHQDILSKTQDTPLTKYEMDQLIEHDKILNSIINDIIKFDPIDIDVARARAEATIHLLCNCINCNANKNIYIPENPFHNFAYGWPTDDNYRCLSLDNESDIETCDCTNCKKKRRDSLLVYSKKKIIELKRERRCYSLNYDLRQ